MVRRGYKRRNAPKKTTKNKNVDPETLVEGELDYAYVFSNKRLLEITKSPNIADFANIQFLKYTAHVCRMENDSTQKQMLFDKRQKQSVWTKTDKILGIARRQAWRLFMDKNAFQRLVDTVYPNNGRHRTSKAS